MAIPRIIHQAWTGPAKLPAKHRRWCRQWRDLHKPDWTYSWWTGRTLKWLEHRDLWDDWERLAPRNKGQFQTNIARLELLWKHGGIWLDTDMQPSGVRLDDLLEQPKGAFLVWQREPGHPKGSLLNTAMMGAEPGHPEIRRLIDGLRDSVAENFGRRSTKTTGVKYVTQRINKRAVNILPAETCFPYLPSQIPEWDAGLIKPGTHATHHWRNNRSGGHVGSKA